MMMSERDGACLPDRAKRSEFTLTPLRTWSGPRGVHGYTEAHACAWLAARAWLHQFFSGWYAAVAGLDSVHVLPPVVKRSPFDASSLSDCSPFVRELKFHCFILSNRSMGGCSPSGSRPSLCNPQ
jgi:hypothetical protein